MLVAARADHLQVVLQPDHGELSGQIASAWSEGLELSAEVREALDLAAARHDDGWAVWERHPRLDDERRPQVFYKVQPESLLSSYQACVDVLSIDSPAAALFVSMHVSGLQRARYGLMDRPQPTPLDELRPEIRAFVEREEHRQATLARELEIDERQRWLAYRQLQVYDVFSLYLGMADLAGAESIEIGPPSSESLVRLGLSPQQALKLTPCDAAWTVACDPFPFRQDPTVLAMRRRILRNESWQDDSSFRSDFDAAQPELVAIRLTA